MDDRFEYLVIPSTYKNVFDELSKKVSEVGTELIEDCKANCKSSNKVIMTCWNMFQAACCAFNDRNVKKADFLINYIIGQLCLKCDKVNNEDFVFEVKERYSEFISFNDEYTITSVGGSIDISCLIDDEVNLINFIPNVSWVKPVVWDRFKEGSSDTFVNFEIEPNELSVTRECIISIFIGSYKITSFKLIQESNENNNWN